MLLSPQSRLLVLCLFCQFGIMGATLAPVRAIAAEPYLEFLQGLRDREYFDYAQLYLDQLVQKENLPADIRAVLPYERAVTLLEASKATRNPQKQVEQLDQALQFLEQFAKDSPSHPMAAEANGQRAAILMGKARVEIQQSRSAANQGNRSEFQKRARQLVTQARTVYQQALALHDSAWQAFGTYIDKSKEPDKFEARGKAEVNMIKAMLELAKTTYEEAQTYDSSAAEYTTLLADAAGQFEKIHQRYRSQVGGLYGRVWQGKCFEEQGDLQKALGIYNELLDHPGDGGALGTLKDQTRQFRLVCLNRRSPPDSQLVVDEGEEWLKQNKAGARTRIGLGIRWEVARAYEALGDEKAANRTEGKADAERLFRLSRGQAQTINKYPGEYRDLSLAMIQRLDIKLGGRDRQPDKFDTAFGLARQMIDPIKKLKEQVDVAIREKKPAEEITKLRQDLTLQLQDAERLFQLSLALATKQDDAKSVSTARHLYAYICFLQRKNYEAAVLAEFVARTADREESNIALDASYLCMAAYVQAYNDQKKISEDRAADMAFVVRAAQRITAGWPGSDSANDARMTLGDILSQSKEPAEAAKWYGQVPESDAKFSKAQLNAGQAYWAAYVALANSASDQQVDKEKLAQHQTAAESHLRTGIGKLASTLPADGASPPELAAAKLSLAQILINRGQDAEAIAVLTVDPHSVMRAITVPDEKNRPEKGVQSQAFASDAYKLLVRAYIGAGKTDDARTAMKSLEKVAAGTPGNDVTQLYVGVSKLLKAELERFQGTGETDRYNSLMASFEAFMNDLSAREDGQTYNSLNWIGETYFALGEASTQDRGRAKAYFDKATNAFEKARDQLLKEAGPNQVTQLALLKLRLVRCARMRNDFQAGEKILGELLKQKPNDLRSQTEAATFYQAWGTSGAADGQAQLLKAISGNEQNLTWGWALLGTKLQGSMDQKQQSDLLPAFFEARYNGAVCRQKYAELHTDLKQRAAELEKAEIELVSTVTIMPDIPEDELARFNKLYRDILSDGGKPQTDIPKLAEAPAAKPIVKKPKKAPKKEIATAVTPPPAPTSDNSMLIFGGLLVVCVVVAGGAFMVLGQKTKKPLRSLAAAPEVSFAGFSEPSPKRRAPPGDGDPAVVKKPKRPAT